jgi:hypothetical protein
MVDCCVLFVLTTATINKRRWDAENREQIQLELSPPWLAPSRPCSTSIFPVGWEVCFVAMGHVEGCRGVRISKIMCERWVSGKETCRPFLTSIFRLPSVDDVFKGIWQPDGVGGMRGVVGSWWQMRRWEIKIFLSTSKHHLKIIDAINISPSFLSTTSRRCIWEATGSDRVEVGQGESGGSMPWWRGGATRGESMSCVSLNLSFLLKNRWV